MTCTKEIILAKKPAVSGTPAREANMMVMASASRGLVLPRPRKAEISSLPRWMRTMARAKKAPKVMTRYTAR